MREELFYDEADNKIIEKVTYDNSEIIEDNKRLKNDRSKREQYKGNFVKAASMDMGDVIRLKNQGYNLLSADQEEVKRALLYIQRNEPHLLTVEGKPFAKKRTVWV